MTDLILHLENLLADIEALDTLHDCHPDKKAIHKLRVRIKMLKALVILLKWYFHDLDPDVLHATKSCLREQAWSVTGNCWLNLYRGRGQMKRCCRN